jgi:hypothetical protein
MMLELILTRQNDTDKAAVRAARGLRFLVLDELHTYRGGQGADVALLVHRVREALNENVLTVGTSTTMVSEGEAGDRRRVVATVASRLFGTPVRPEDVVTETLARVTPEAEPWDRAALAAAIVQPLPVEAEHAALRTHPLAAWVETRLGLDREAGKWVRTRTPRSLEQAARLLAEESGCEAATCERALKAFLLLAYRAKDPQGRSLFAFRLHQFVSGAGISSARSSRKVRATSPSMGSSSSPRPTVPSGCSTSASAASAGRNTPRSGPRSAPMA